MTAKVYVTGNLGADPELRFTQSGRPVLDMSIGCTPRAKNQQTGQWEDQGAPLWLRASVWDMEAEKWAERLRKGHRVTVEGDLMKRTYTDQQGQPRESLELRYPKVLGYEPKQTAPAVNAYSGQPMQQATYDAPAGGQACDPWATGDTRGAASFSNDAPF